MKRFSTLLVSVFIFSLLLLPNSSVGTEPVTKLRAGFVYVGPIADFGWTNAHEQARLEVMKKFSWLESVFVEDVKEADAARVIDRLIQEENCDLVFTTSFGYMNDTVAAAQRYPEKIFLHCSGTRREKNLGTYFAELYQPYYLNGLMAGALSKSGKVGYLGAHPIPEIIRHINAYALGVKAANPKAVVQVKWLFNWYDPAKAREAAEALVAEGCDALAFTEDSPAVIQVGEEHTSKGKPVYTFSHYSPMQKFGENSCVSGQLVNWTVMYEEIFQRLHDKTWTPQDYWWRMSEKAAQLGGTPGQPVNPKFVEPLRQVMVDNPDLGKTTMLDLITKRSEQMSAPTVAFEPFTGPITDQAGALRLHPGEVASQTTLWEMNWFVENVRGEIPR